VVKNGDDGECLYLFGLFDVFIIIVNSCGLLD